MKVYRIIPDSFVIEDRNRNISGLNETKNIATEDIYYNMGYVSLSNKKYSIANKVIDMLVKSENGDFDKMGKYFYIFPEDAVMFATQLFHIFHRVKSNCARLVEYDIPDELIMKYYGYGTYDGAAGNEYAAECYLTEDDFKGKVISSNEISIEDKRKALLKSLKQTLQGLTDVDTYLEPLNEYFCEVFKTNDLKEVLNDEKKLKEILFNSTYYKKFIKKEVNIVKTPYITGNVLSLPLKSFHIVSSSNNEYCKSKGFNLDFTSENIDYMSKCAKYVSQDMDEKEKQYVLDLLKNRRG